MSTCLNSIHVNKFCSVLQLLFMVQVKRGRCSQTLFSKTSARPPTNKTRARSLDLVRRIQNKQVVTYNGIYYSTNHSSIAATSTSRESLTPICPRCIATYCLSKHNKVKLMLKGLKDCVLKFVNSRERQKCLTKQEFDRDYSTQSELQYVVVAARPRVS